MIQFKKIVLPLPYGVDMDGWIGRPNNGERPVVYVLSTSCKPKKKKGGGGRPLFIRLYRVHVSFYFNNIKSLVVGSSAETEFPHLYLNAWGNSLTKITL